MNHSDLMTLERQERIVSLLNERGLRRRRQA
jgi:hypothetical protein